MIVLIEILRVVIRQKLNLLISFRISYFAKDQVDCWNVIYHITCYIILKKHKNK